MPNGINVDNIDDLLAKEFNIVEDENYEDNEDITYTDDDDMLDTSNVEDNDDNNQDDTNLGEDNHDQEDEEENSSDVVNPTGSKEEPKANGENVKSSKPSKEEQREYSFAQFRQENAKLKQERQQLEQIAKAKGYNNVEDFIKDLTAANDTLEAQKNNIDPVIYRELMETKRRNQQLEQMLNERDFESRVGTLREVLDETITELELGDDGTNFIMKRLEEYGFTADEILKEAHNPKKVASIVKSVLIDKIQEKATQSQLSKLDKLNKVADDKHTGNSAKGKLDLDKLIKQEMDELKANYFY